jgi:anti-sigma factor RsiW
MTAADRPTVAHPDLDTLADLDAGALDPAAAEDVAAHVGGCARCVAAMAAFDGIRRDLRALPTPRVPPEVAARLDATLAELRGETAGPAAAPPPPRPVADLAGARERRRRRSLKIGTGAVAAAAVLIAAGASVTALVNSAGQVSDTTSGAAGAASLSDESAPRATRSAAVPNSLGGIPSYTKETLSGSLDTIARDSAVTDVTTLGETGPAGEMADAARRQACEQSITLRHGVLTAARRIDYEGKPAYVFVFTDANGRLCASVVDTTCGTTGGLPATVLDSVP